MAPRKLAISGSLNGGLLVAATMLQRPELFGAALADVPVPDALRLHPSGNGLQQVDQWGTPDDPVVFPVMHVGAALNFGPLTGRGLALRDVGHRAAAKVKGWRQLIPDNGLTDSVPFKPFYSCAWPSVGVGFGM